MDHEREYHCHTAGKTQQKVSVKNHEELVFHAL